MTHELAFSIGGTTVPVPPEIQGLVGTAGQSNFGIGLIAPIISILFVIAAIIALFIIVWGGYRWIMSQGDPKEIAGARNTIIYAAIGLGVTFLSYFIVNLLSCFLGVPLLGKTCG